jgi:glucan phosphoethanolaminetransferase (alkaline phosphatase superfamily)
MRTLLIITLCAVALVMFPDVAMAKGKVRFVAMPRDLNHPFYSAALLFIACGGLLRFIGWVKRRIASPAISGVLSRLGYAMLSVIMVVGGIALFDHTKTYDPKNRSSSYQTSQSSSSSSIRSGGARFVSARTND